MQEQLSISSQSSNETMNTKSIFDNGENMLDNSIMVDPRKGAGYKIPLDDFEVDNNIN